MSGSQSLTVALGRLPQDVRYLVRLEVAMRLLANPYDWRERRVDSIAPQDPGHYRQRTSIQFRVDPLVIEGAVDRVHELLRDVLHDFNPGNPGAVPQSLQDPRALEDALQRLQGVKDLDSLWGQEATLLVPLLTLPKKLLMNFNLVDHRDESVPLLNRFSNSSVATYYLWSRNLIPTEDAPLSPQTLVLLNPVIRALCFCIPDGVLHESNFRSDDLVLDPDMTTEESLSAATDQMCEFLVKRIQLQRRSPDDPIEDVEATIRECRPRVAELLRRGRSLFQALGHQLTWAQVKEWRDPITNPLLLFPDHVKLLREERETIPPRSLTDKLNTFARFSEEFISAVERLSDRAVSSDEPDERRRCRNALLGLTRFSHSWVAFAEMRLPVGEPMLAKLEQTLPIGWREDVGRWKKGTAGSGAWSGLRQTYDIQLGDAHATHIEVTSPDSSAIGLAPKKTRVAFGPLVVKEPEQVRSIFGIEYSESKELQTFYTTKNIGELERLYQDFESEGGRRQELRAIQRGVRWLVQRQQPKAWRNTVRKVKRWERPRRLVEVRDWLVGRARQDVRSAKSLEVAQLEVRFRSQLALTVLYWIAAVLGLGVASAVGWAVIVVDRSAYSPATLLTLMGFMSFFSTFLIVRQRGSLMARRVLWARITLAVAVGMLVLSLLVGLRQGDFKGEAERPTTKEEEGGAAIEAPGHGADASGLGL